MYVSFDTDKIHAYAQVTFILCVVRFSVAIINKKNSIEIFCIDMRQFLTGFKVLKRIAIFVVFLTVHSQNEMVVS